MFLEHEVRQTEKQINFIILVQNQGYMKDKAVALLLDHGPLKYGEKIAAWLQLARFSKNILERSLMICFVRNLYTLH